MCGAEEPGEKTCSTTDEVSEKARDVAAYDVGERVEYWSETLQKYILAVVKTINPDGSYDLDVKRMAPTTHLRRLQPGVVLNRKGNKILGYRGGGGPEAAAQGQAKAGRLPLQEQRVCLSLEQRSGGKRKPRQSGC
ncbi:unnamed protein product [Prorocentrum cordatum]|uniref:Uncharacterized protein n=1 Tax=Prorocentrum cordatum TaxID=2364126 RepID=A0ABN9V2S1_9DINO|nr:unnamed protein product [Polarella glacialis]